MASASGNVLLRLSVLEVKHQGDRHDHQRCASPGICDGGRLMLLIEPIESLS